MMLNSVPPEWKANLRLQLLEEISSVQQRINLSRAPLLILTGMGLRGSFEISWNCNKNVILIFATTKTWDYILNKICKISPGDVFPRVLEDKKTDFLSKVSKKPENRKYLGINNLAFYQEQIRKIKPWKTINDSSFGKWVELSVFLPSFIDWRFGPNLELANDQQQNAFLSYAKKYADAARSFFESRGQGRRR